jgi:peptidoglycan/xylan/chitin deacetylase (PgdA/CDA1 family)
VELTRSNSARTAAIVALVLLAALASAVHAELTNNHGDRIGGVIAVSPLPWRIGRELASSNEFYVTRAEEDRALAQLVHYSTPLFCGGLGRYAALTFDDGPSPTSPELLSLLRRAGVPATFFVVGRNAQQRPAELGSLQRAGAIGNHTWSHPQLTLLKPPAIANELRLTNTLLAAHVPPRSAPYRMSRPPYGARNTMVTTTFDHLHYAEILWSADSADALGRPWQVIAQNVKNGLGPGAVILMHDGPAATLEALRRKILPAIRRSGLTMVTVPELLVLDPPGKQRLESGPHGCAHAGKVNVSGNFASRRGEG